MSKIFPASSMAASALASGIRFTLICNGDLGAEQYLALEELETELNQCAQFLAYLEQNKALSA